MFTFGTFSEKETMVVHTSSARDEPAGSVGAAVEVPTDCTALAEALDLKPEFQLVTHAGAEEYVVHIQKTCVNQELGIGVRLFNKGFVEVLYVKSGLIDEWNRRHPDVMVTSGDELLSVNEVRQDVALELRNVVAAEQELFLRFRRRS
uniref:PDZ domain-containing protein n=1 Tax=Noctiluca scintillans TaxID=2966 RepID=A0A7S0ZP56_NOCSC|mmetsp:Transcript_12297/g.33782  ORF Transcript_12297/g.33782 Transcript_12297/m.33782 type:complete len:148 (+) Transcript_12297:59-502(+)